MRAFFWILLTASVTAAAMFNWQMRREVKRKLEDPFYHVTCAEMAAFRGEACDPSTADRWTDAPAQELLQYHLWKQSP